MVLTRAAAGALEESSRDMPVALPGEILIKVSACGVCRTDLHLVAGELPQAEHSGRAGPRDRRGG